MKIKSSTIFISIFFVISIFSSNSSNLFHEERLTINNIPKDFRFHIYEILDIIDLYVLKSVSQKNNKEIKEWIVGKDHLTFENYYKSICPMLVIVNKTKVNLNFSISYFFGKIVRSETIGLFPIFKEISKIISISNDEKKVNYISRSLIDPEISDTITHLIVKNKIRSSDYDKTILITNSDTIENFSKHLTEGFIIQGIPIYSKIIVTDIEGDTIKATAGFIKKPK